MAECRPCKLNNWVASLKMIPLSSHWSIGYPMIKDRRENADFTWIAALTGWPLNYLSCQPHFLSASSLKMKHKYIFFSKWIFTGGRVIEAGLQCFVRNSWTSSILAEGGGRRRWSRRGPGDRDRRSAWDKRSYKGWLNNCWVFSNKRTRNIIRTWYICSLKSLPVI